MVQFEGDLLCWCRRTRGGGNHDRHQRSRKCVAQPTASLLCRCQRQGLLAPTIAYPDSPRKRTGERRAECQPRPVAGTWADAGLPSPAAPLSPWPKQKGCARWQITTSPHCEPPAPHKRPCRRRRCSSALSCLPSLATPWAWRGTTFCCAEPILEMKPRCLRGNGHNPRDLAPLQLSNAATSRVAERFLGPAARRARGFAHHTRNPFAGRISQRSAGVILPSAVSSVHVDVNVLQCFHSELAFQGRVSRPGRSVFSHRCGMMR